MHNWAEGRIEGYILNNGDGDNVGNNDNDDKLMTMVTKVTSAMTRVMVRFMIAKSTRRICLLTTLAMTMTMQIMVRMRSDDGGNDNDDNDKMSM